MRPPMMSGHCSFPVTEDKNGNPLTPEYAHSLCSGGNTANPKGEFQPCPCPCHLGEGFDCECGGLLREAPLWPNEDEPGEMVYTHVDHKTGRAVGEMCP